MSCGSYSPKASTGSSVTDTDSPTFLKFSACSILGKIPEWPPCRYDNGSAASSSSWLLPSYNLNVMVTTALAKTFMETFAEWMRPRGEARNGGVAHCTVPAWRIRLPLYSPHAARHANHVAGRHARAALHRTLDRK